MMIGLEIQENGYRHAPLRQGEVEFPSVSILSDAPTPPSTPAAKIGQGGTKLTCSLPRVLGLGVPQPLRSRDTLKWAHGRSERPSLIIYAPWIF